MGVGLALFVEALAGALTGGGAGQPDSPSADRPINDLLSILIDPEPMGGAAALADDIERLMPASCIALPDAGREVRLPGELERRTRAGRLARGIPLDPTP